ncbi:hypothetical protein F5141DRAFT_1067528 [Pisolithus sp. B1]|nr:hypothetical protein F5141DRAFT_1067528 [Pisolithus sp. B1]
MQTKEQLAQMDCYQNYIVQNDLHLGYMKFLSKHSKISAWNAFCWKKGQAVDGSNENVEDKNCLVEEFSEFRKSKAIGICVMTKSKINDITHTLKVVENKLHNLKLWTGVETMFYATCGTTDLPLQGVAFATEGVVDFMGSVMGIDTQDLISKLEGFAVQGIKGVAENHQQCISNICATIRNIINCQLHEFFPNPHMG